MRKVDDYVFEWLDHLDAAENAGGDVVEVFAVGEEASTFRAPQIPVLARVRSSSWAPPAGVEITSRLGDVVALRATRAGIQQLSDDVDVVAVEASREAGELDCALSIPYVKGSQVHAPPHSERGDHALIAILDTGVDILHHGFSDALGACRIEGVWDQAGSGPSPMVATNNRLPFNYGTYYAANTIAGYRGAGQRVPTVLRDPGGHGTHVASIAAGRAAGSFKGGMAPEARILVVAARSSSPQGSATSIGYSASHADALSLVAAAADTLGLPVIVNVSQGMNAGAHDGSSLLEAAFDAFSDGGRMPGRIIVKSAGNERGQHGHASFRVHNHQAVTLEWRSSTNARAEDYLELWFKPSASLRFTLVNPQRRQSPAVDRTRPKASGALGTDSYSMVLTRFHVDNGDSRLLISIRPPAGGVVAPGTWAVVVEGLSVHANSDEVDAWIERTPARPIDFLNHTQDEVTLSIPGTARHVISVANIQVPGQGAGTYALASNSSYGATRDQRQKPDLAAPGVQIEAARSNAGPGDVSVKSGTSMAAPHVSGALALLLSKLHRQGAPLLNLAQAAAALRCSSQHYSGAWTHGVGYGTLDAEALLDLF